MTNTVASAETPIQQEAKASSKDDGVKSSPFAKPPIPFPTPIQLSKQAALQQARTGPLPPSFYSSFPTAGKESSTTSYHITSVKGFSAGTFYAVLNGKLELIGQAKASKKAVAIEQAEKMAAAGKVQAKVENWQFEESKNGQPVKPVKLMAGDQKFREQTGPVPLLTHALSVEEGDKARIAWLEWFSEDKKA